MPKRRSLWFFNKSLPSVSTQNLSMSKSKSKINKGEEVEREWLLLGEPPSSPQNRSVESPIEESSILSDPQSDIDCIAKIDGSESDSSTDIDAIVDEYRQKVKVSTAGLRDNNLRVPSIGSWRLTMLCVLMIIGGSVSAAVGAKDLSLSLFLTGIFGEFSFPSL